MQAKSTMHCGMLQGEHSAILLTFIKLLFVIKTFVLSMSMHKHNFGQKFKLESALVTLNIRSRSSKPNQLFSVSKQCIYAGLVEIHPLVHKIELRKGNFLQFFLNGDLENKVKVTKISSALHFAKMIKYIKFS